MFGIETRVRRVSEHRDVVEGVQGGKLEEGYVEVYEVYEVQ